MTTNNEITRHDATNHMERMKRNQFEIVLPFSNHHSVAYKLKSHTKKIKHARIDTNEEFNGNHVKLRIYDIYRKQTNEKKFVTQ